MLVAHADATIYPVISQYFFAMIFFGFVFYSYSLCILLHETVYPREIDVGGGTHREWENKQTNEQKRKCFRSIMVVFCYVWRCYTNNIKWQGYKKVYTHAISKMKQKNQNSAKDCTNERTEKTKTKEKTKEQKKTFSKNVWTWSEKGGKHA